MLSKVEDTGFQSINRRYNAVFHVKRLSLGLVLPIETYSSEKTVNGQTVGKARGKDSLGICKSCSIVLQRRSEKMYNNIKGRQKALLVIAHIIFHRLLCWVSCVFAE